MEIELRRQTIFNRKGAAEAYDIIFVADLDGEDETSKAKFHIVKMQVVAEYGLKKLGEGKRVFVDTPVDTLILSNLDLLNKEGVGYRLVSPTTPVGYGITARVVDHIEALKTEGALIAVTLRLLKDIPSLFDFADIVEFSAETHPDPEVWLFRNEGKGIWVRDIKTQEQYNAFKEKADMFEGDFLKPAVELQKTRLAPFLRSTLLRLLIIINTARTPAEFARIIETDVGMSAKLLRFLNSAYFSLRGKIRTVEQAAVYFGLKNLKNFVLVLAMNDYASVENSEVWRRALVRAKTMEELVKRTDTDLAGEAYMVGLFSLLDSILDVNVVDFLEEANVDEVIIEAIENDSSFLNRLLVVADFLEENIFELSQGRISMPEAVANTLDSIHVSLDDAIEIVRSSMAVADTIMRF